MSAMPGASGSGRRATPAETTGRDVVRDRPEPPSGCRCPAIAPSYPLDRCAVAIVERLYFAYGSNMSSPRLAARIPGTRALGAARLSHVRLAFDKPGADGTGKANLVPAPRGWVWGVVWTLSGMALDSLDRFEPGYARVERIVRFRDGRERSATTYVWSGPSLERPPAAWYVGHLVQGAREHALPHHWRAHLAEALRGARAGRR
jgi:gamma-glutamylcyclotransferase (GGCT)/AIG2-like uncharacterized protein YtfP